MTSYSVKINASSEIKDELKAVISANLNGVVYKLNSKYSEDVVNGLNKDDMFFAISGNPTWMTDFLVESKKLFITYGISCVFKVSVSEILDFNVDGNPTLGDTIDYLSSMLNLIPGLALGQCLTTNINYMCFLDDLVYNVTLKAYDLNKMNIVINVDLESDDEKEKVSNIIYLLKNSFDSIVQTLK